MNSGGVPMAKISPSEMPVPRGPHAFGGRSRNPSGLRDVRAVHPRMSPGPRPATRPTTLSQSAFDMYFGTG